MPVYWTYLAVVAMATYLGGYHDTVATWIGSLTYTRNIIGHGESLTGHFWSLAVEQQFYFVWPTILLLFVSRGYRQLLIFILSLATLAIIFRIHQCGIDEPCRLLLGPRSILLYMDAILIGCLMGVLWVIKAGAGRAISSVWLRSALVTVLLISISGYMPIPRPYLNFLQAVVVGSYLYSLLSAPSTVEKWLLENPGAIYVGKLSYSFYIWHFLFLEYFNQSLFGAIQPFVNKYWILISFVVAVGSYHLLESPLRKYLNSRFVKQQVLPNGMPRELDAAALN